MDESRAAVHVFPARYPKKASEFRLFEDGSLEYVAPGGHVRSYEGCSRNLTSEMLHLVEERNASWAEAEVLAKRIIKLEGELHDSQ